MKFVVSIIICMAMSQAIVGLSFHNTENGVVVDSDDNVADILDQLGEPQDKKITDYGHFSFILLDYGFLKIGYSVFPGGSPEESLDFISICDPSVTTSRGISVGDSITNVIAEYGEPFRHDLPLAGVRDTGSLIYSYAWRPKYRDENDRTPVTEDIWFVYDTNGLIIEITVHIDV